MTLLHLQYVTLDEFMLQLIILPKSFCRELDNVLENLKKSTNSNMSTPNYHRPPSVISLDDSFGLPSPSERNVVVKVRTRTGIQRFTMKAVSIAVHHSPSTNPLGAFF